MLERLFLAFVVSSIAVAFPAPRDTPPPDPPNVPIVFPERSQLADCPGYAASNVKQTDSSLTADLTLAGPACNSYSQDLQNLKLVVEYQTNERLHVQIFDAEENVFQVQQEVLPRPQHEQASSSNAALQFNLTENPFSFAVVRRSNGEVLFDSAASSLVFQTQYVRLRTNLPNDPNLYGLGEHTDSFRLTTSNYERVLYNSESPNVHTNNNLYGSHPVYFDHRGDKGTHGVFLLNSDPMNIYINKTESGEQYLEYNTIGGIIDLYFLAGAQPAEVSQQYADVVGHSAMFPYWSFGFQQCKYGYWDVNMVAEVVGNYSTAEIPLEVMYTDIDYMHLREDFTTDPERFPISKMRELVQTLHERDQRYVLILDPGIHTRADYAPFQRGHDKNVFLKNADGSDYLGVQWAGVSAWPDWFAPNTQQWWTDELTAAFSPESGIDIDGVWVDMNEASNFCHDRYCDPAALAEKEGNPPIPTSVPRPNTGRPIPGFPASFQPNNSLAAKRQVETGTKKGLPNRELFEPNYHINNHRGNLSDFTIYTNNTNYDGTRQYDTHNFYGHMMAHTTHTSMLARRPSVRPFVLTRSTWAGSGRKVTHWFGDNASTWEHYRMAIRQMLSFVSMHQMPMVGSDVCGFNSNADEYMCARWALLGAFQPFYRNHAEISTRQQEFYQWPIVAEAAKVAIYTRYKLMDYAYTALYYQHLHGTPMVNPLFFLYPEDPNTFGIQEQWFYGDALLISPVTNDYSDTVSFYLPKDTFYDYWSHARVDSEGRNHTLSGLDWKDIPVHIRGGTIIPERADWAWTTKELRTRDFVVIVAPGQDGTATGRLYLDDGESIEQASISEIEFSWDGSTFACTGTFGYNGNSGESVTVKQVTVLGQEKAGSTGHFNPEKKEIVIDGPWKLNGAWGFAL
ncbi:glycoside hydrolase family 31 protein [Aaosphaeria arxii CBS 175.79]|uniref:alpha-glucosidase n=1 Tax=Aaosphaeria arxii CBS 175.79 TaxID=1450172 RepID=A0A6A5Y5R4_9PLEO|nr:glycoside hydrolase family 31 protein [Aaosphaeria arxii CBS 175.79]KAF2020858.1 glycoside hydrolase family 31 protein [Aaosphaeria arxii CBS 175.79]